MDDLINVEGEWRARDMLPVNPEHRKRVLDLMRPPADDAASAKAREIADAFFDRQIDRTTFDTRATMRGYLVATIAAALRDAAPAATSEDVVAALLAHNLTYGEIHRRTLGNGSGPLYEDVRRLAAALARRAVGGCATGQAGDSQGVTDLPSAQPATPVAPERATPAPAPSGPRCSTCGQHRPHPEFGPWCMYCGRPSFSEDFREITTPTPPPAEGTR